MARAAMPTTALASLALLGGIAAGCGADADTPDVEGAVTTTTTTPASGGAAVSTEPTPTVAPDDGTDPDELSVGLSDATALVAGPTTWSIEIRNDGDAAAILRFATEQQVEIELTSAGSVIHRWSDGRFFAPEPAELSVEPGGSVVVEVADDLGDLEPGFYDATITVVSRRPLEPRTVNIRVGSVAE